MRNCSSGSKTHDRVPDPADAQRAVTRYGFHVRDRGLRESALSRPATTVMGQDASIGLPM
jgi:death on curing protein